MNSPDTAAPAVAFERVSFAFDDNVVLRDVSFSVPKGAMCVILGASGAGKSIMLKLILGLFKPDAGRIFVDGRRIDDMTERDLMTVRADIGMLFQETALFDSLTVADNVGYRLYAEGEMPAGQIEERIREVLGFLGLAQHLERMPSELSGGQRRRVAIGRAIASRPRLLLFDDPTSGLDPITSTSIDDEIVKLRDIEQVTSLVATHQIRDAYYLATHDAVQQGDDITIRELAHARPEHSRFLMLHEGRIHFEGSAEELLASKDPYLTEFLFMTLPPW